MREIRVSRTYLEALHALLAYGEQRFGSMVVDEKRARVDRMIRLVLAHHPRVGRFEPGLGVYSIPVSSTPFTLLYDFDEVEVRVHSIVHARADRSRLDMSDIEW